MLNLIDLYKKNRETYYNFATQKELAVWPRYLTLFSIVAVISVFTDYPSEGLIGTIVSALSILAGFSFGVQFVIVDRSFIGEARLGSIEDHLTRKKVQKLASEIFDNIAYFNAVCIFGIIVACCLFLELSLGLIETMIPAEVVSKYFFAAGIIGKFILFSIVSEAFLTFFRLLERINYLFQKVRAA
ncbi:hypothetical protein [Sphingorhabdus sp. Alg231-15]|uniref:hypothetical protein n=1 Tax=Sphingorhabdus sp. Alg231-15 TaxID=1922222 RepID=UPI000D55AB56